MTLATILALCSAAVLLRALANVFAEIVNLSTGERRLLLWLAHDEETRVEIQGKLMGVFETETPNREVDSAEIDDLIPLIERQLLRADLSLAELDALHRAINQPCERSRVAYLQKTFEMLRGQFGDLEYAS